MVTNVRKGRKKQYYIISVEMDEETKVASVTKGIKDALKTFPGHPEGVKFLSPRPISDRIMYKVFNIKTERGSI